jgi:ribosomal protein S12 methylthiotransferase accessory factor
VPFETVTLNMVAYGQPGNVPSFFVSSNGLASGNHMLEAVSHGLCEVIERDAAALLPFERSEHGKARQLDLATIDDPGCRWVLGQLERAGVTVAVWDITSDIGVPTYSCLIVDGDEHSRGRALGTAGGYGCHLSPGIAVLRALTEAAQGRTSRIAGSRDDVPLEDFLVTSNADDQRWLRSALVSPPPTLDFRSRSSLATDSFKEDLEVLLGALARAGIDSAVAVDLSRPEIGIPVVKLVVPDLEVQLGGVDQPLRPGPRARTHGRGQNT